MDGYWRKMKRLIVVFMFGRGLDVISGWSIDQNSWRGLVMSQAQRMSFAMCGRNFWRGCSRLFDVIGNNVWTWLARNTRVDRLKDGLLKSSTME